MAVTPDRYELPLAVCLSADELGRAFGIKGRSILANIARNENGKVRGAKFIRIDMEEEDEYEQ
jgi:ribosomal protein L7Ae-like RNA K-turn-binding protein